MKSIAKSFGKLNQMVGEKFAGATKHQQSEEFKVLEAKTESRKDATDALLEACLSYIKSIDKTKDIDKSKARPIEILGSTMISYGSDLPEESQFGQVLLKVGDAQDKIGKIQQVYVQTVRESFVKRLEEFMAEMKTYKHLKAKLESRRLDYDAKMNRIQKSKKENPELDQELRSSQAKYEETMQELETLMIALNDREEGQLEGLNKFLEAQHEYHLKAAEMLSHCKQIVNNPEVKGNRLHLPKSHFTGSQSDLTAANLTLHDESQATPQRASTSTSQTLASDKLGVPYTATRMPSQMTYSTVGGASTMTSRQVSEYHQEAPSLPQRATQSKLVRANYSFMAENKNEMSIQKGDVISVLKEVDEGWWVGEVNGQRGMFPANYVEVIQQSAIDGSVQGNPASTQEPSKDNPLVKSSSVPKFSYVDTKNLSKTPPTQRVVPEINKASKPITPPMVRKEPPPKPERSGDNISKRSLHDVSYPKVISQCGVCDCNQWTENVFKPQQCNNCFHSH